MRQQRIGFLSGKLTLEGIITIPESGSIPFPGVVIGHPHPVFGGNMSSQLMHSISLKLDSLGIATLRFNFRGVGTSEGIFDQGKSEQGDLISAWNTFRQWPGLNKKQFGLLGISFGAAVALDCIDRLKDIAALCAVSPTENSLLRSKLGKMKIPKFILTGANDNISKGPAIEEAILKTSPDTSFNLMPNADHTWTGEEDNVSSIISEFFSTTLPGKT